MENQRALSLSKTLPRHRRRPKKKERKRCNVFVPVVLVISHSDAYLLRSSTPLLTKWGEQTKMCSGVVVRFGENCALVWFFSHNKTHQKRGISLSSHTNESNRRPRNATQKKRVLIITNSPVVGTVENEIDFFSVRPPFRSTLCWLNAYQGERSSISSRVVSSICVDRAESRERKNHKNHVDEHIGRKGVNLIFF